MLYANSRITERDALRPRNDLVVLGCSFAALEFLYRLVRRRGVFQANECVVVEPAARHTYLPLAHEVASGVASVSENTFDAAAFCAGIGAVWCPRAAVAVDPGARTVELDDGSRVAFSRLVIAVGSVATAPAGAGVFAAKRVEDAARLYERLTPSDNVTVVGGGITGVEWSAELARRAARVTLITETRDILPSFAPGIRRHAAQRLARLGVNVITGRRVADNSGDDIIVWAAGVKASPVLQQFGLPLTDDGHLIVDERLSVPGHPDIYGIGDAVRPSGDRAIDAIWQGAYLARRFARQSTGSEGPKYKSNRSFFYGLSLGRAHSVILRGAWWADTPLFVAFRRWLRCAYYARFTLLHRWYALQHALDRRHHLARRARLG
jgi:NADH dehydrogenase FAD-containing subunit